MKQGINLSLQCIHLHVFSFFSSLLYLIEDIGFLVGIRSVNKLLFELDFEKGEY